MRRTLSNEDLTPESAQLVKTLMDPYNPTRNQEAVESPAFTNIAWVTSQDFTVETGHRQIQEYIRTWSLPPSWLYSLDYLGVTKEQFFTFYHYRARFSTPTARSPVVGTASVYFAVNKVQPETLPVDVHFVIESNRLVNRAGRVVFREKWLADVIESKILLRKNVQDLWAQTDWQTAASTMDSDSALSQTN
ncbi:hypothetical protein WMY93_021703 [Mugilogobius chulae]|uniref:Uncharacterized protein n=1 Tax=Mugilogobius chulae TaxID=88201 RepID=A0AAW0NBL5_9GOBI